MRSTLTPKSGFTLIEFLMAIALMATLSVLSIVTITNTLNESRFATTLTKLTRLRKALVGEVNLMQGQSRSDFGYLGDLGALPTTAQGLSALIANPGVAAWGLNASSRVSTGWNGPYIKADDSDSTPTVDGWGNAWVYAPAATPPTLTSLGSDGAVGGAGYAADLTMQMPINTTTSVVHGFILEDAAQWAGAATIELNVPNSAGSVQQLSTTITAADKGHFVFSGVPMGVRSVTVYIPNKTTPTVTVGPVVFVVDKPHMVIDTNLLDVSISGPTNLEVPIEMVDYGLSSGIIGLFNTFERTRTSLNTTDYDGIVTYSFEIVATNLSLLPQVVSIVSSAGVSVGALTLPTGTATPTRFRTAMIPIAGSDNYRIQFPITLLANQVNIYAGRIIINQVGATKTRVYVPLIAGNIGSVSNTDMAAVDATNSTTYSQPSPLNYSIWKKEGSALSLASGNPYTLEVVLTGGLLGSASVALYNKTSGLAVTGASVTSSGLAYSMQQAHFADTATNLNDLADYEVRIRSSSALQTVGIAKAGLWIRLASLGSGQVFYRVARAYTGAASPVFDENRALVTTSSFSNPSIYAEGVARSTSVTGTTLSILDAATADSGVTGSALSGAGLTWGTTKSRQRSAAALTLTNGSRYMGSAQTSAAQTSSVSSGTVVVQFHH